MQYLQPSLIAVMIILTNSSPFVLIETWPIGEAKPSTILSLVTLILLQSTHIAKLFILPVILLFCNHYLPATAEYSRKLFVEMKFLVKQHSEPGNKTLSHSVKLCHAAQIPPRFPCINPS